MLFGSGFTDSSPSAIAPTKMQLKSGPFYSTDGLSCVISREYPMLVTVLHLIPVGHPKYRAVFTPLTRGSDRFSFLRSFRCFSTHWFS